MAKSSDTTNDRSRKPRKLTVKPLPPEAGKVIADIYSLRQGKRDDSLQKIEKTVGRRRSRRLLIILVVLALLVASTVAGFLTFYRRQYFNEQGVTLKVETPNSVTSGGETTVNLTIANDTPVATRDTELSLSAPDGWTYGRSDPAPSDGTNTLWRLGTVPARGKRSVSVVGQLAGEVGSVKTFSATVTYRPANFNYDFTARASGSVTVGSSILELNFQGPTQTTPGAPATYTLTYTNNSSDDLRGLRLIATYPDGFTPTTLEPKPREGNSVWVLDEVKSGGTGEIKLHGSFGGEVGASFELTFVAELQRGGFPERQAETSLVVIVVASGFNLKLTVNEVDKDSVANPGQTLQYKLSYENASDIEVRDVRITAKLSGGGVNLASFNDDHGAKLKDGSVSWDVKLVPDLATLKPGAAGNLRFSVKVLDSPKPIDAGGPTVIAAVSANITALGANGGKPESIVLAPLETKVTSKPTLSVDPRYYSDDGEPLGAGPLPPTVGQTTTYRISWFLGNTTNELTNIGVSATVPTTVFWTGRNVTTTAGEVNFDPNARTVSWTLNRLPRGVGQDTSTLVASFEVSVTPLSTDLGSILTLLEVSTLTATDSFTGTVLTVKRDKATTDLHTDPVGAGKGVVVATAT